MENFEAICRTVLICVTLLAALFFGNYVVDLERRITVLEESTGIEIVIPDFDRFLPYPFRGDETP